MATQKFLQIGFSGTREGMNDFQKEHVKHWLIDFMLKTGMDDSVWFHHGGCVGADLEAHHIARESGYHLYLHPPVNTFAQAILPTDCDKSDDPFSFSGRNQRIVLATDVLIAAPKKSSGGGTWNTIQHAINARKPHIIVYRDRIEVKGERPANWVLPKPF